jgi:hypothetical protein
MPRKKTSIDILANLELMSRDMSFPEAIRAEAAREYVRLKAATNPAPVPAPIPVAPVEPDFSEIEAAAAKVKPVERSESQQFAHDVEVSRRPEPTERERNSIWTVGGVQHTYLGMEGPMHLLTPMRASNVGQPEVVRVSEDRLMNKRYTVRRTDSHCETVEECKARLWQEMQRNERERIALGGRRMEGDPEGT